MRIVSFDEIFGAESEKESEKPKIDHEAQVMELTAYFDDYQRSLGRCLFEAGDMVTPKANAGSANAGQPHIVLHVKENAEYGPDLHRHDMLVAYLDGDGDFTPMWTASFLFVPYEVANGA